MRVFSTQMRRTTVPFIFVLAVLPITLPADAQGRPKLVIQDVPGSIKIEPGCTPPYTEAAFKEEWTGSTDFAFQIDAQGKVLAGKVLNSGYRRMDKELDELGLAALAKCSFTPARKGGYEVESWVKVRYAYQLPEGGAVNVIYKRFDGNVHLDSQCGPPTARNGEYGRTLLAFLVAPDGQALDAKVVRPSPFPQMDTMALAKMRTCRFDPVREGGKSIKAVIHVVHDWEEYRGPNDPRWERTRVLKPSAKRAPEPDRAPPAGWTLVAGDGENDRTVGGWYLHFDSVDTEEKAYEIIIDIKKTFGIGATIHESKQGATIYHVVYGPYDRSIRANSMKKSVSGGTYMPTLVKKPG